MNTERLYVVSERYGKKKTHVIESVAFPTDREHDAAAWASFVKGELAETRKPDSFRVFVVKVIEEV